MAFSMRLGAGVAPHPLENPSACDFHCYARQSSVQSYGNANTGVQEEDLPRLVARRFGIDTETHECFRRYAVEVESASDGNIRIQRDARGRIIIDDFERQGLLNILDVAVERWHHYRRPAVIAVTMLNRLGRSHIALPLLEGYANDCEGNLYVYVAGTGTLLNLTDPSDQTVLVAEFSFSGKGENRTKQLAVQGARRRIGSQCGAATRSLGEKPFGYDKFACDYNGVAVDPAVWLQAHGKKPSRAFRKAPELQGIVQRIYDLCTLDRLSAGRIAARVQLEYGDHPTYSRPWSRYHVERILSNPIYRGQRVTDRTKALNLGATRRRRAARQDEIVISPVDESLRMITDEQWYLAQEIQCELGAAEQGGAEKHSTRRGKAGRPLNADLLLHRTGLLRCALCGVVMKTNKLDPNYYYRCSHRAEAFGQIRCQSHDARIIDGAIVDAVRSLFSEVQDFAEVLRGEVKQLRAQGKLTIAEKQLTAARDELERLELALMLAATDLHLGKIDQARFERQRAIVDKKAEQVSYVEERRNSLSSDAVVKAKEARLQQLEGMATFDRVPIERKRGLLADLFVSVWLWPDGKFEFQWKGEDEAEVTERTGRQLRIAAQWPTLDFSRLLTDTYAILDRTSMPFLVLDNGEVSGSLRHSFAAMKRGKAQSARYHLPIFKGFVRARAAYMDVPALSRDLRAFYYKWIDAGKGSADLERATGISYRTWKRIGAGQQSKWSAFRDHLDAMGVNQSWDASAYTTVPPELYSHPLIEEMSYWLL